VAALSDRAVPGVVMSGVLERVGNRWIACDLVRFAPQHLNPIVDLLFSAVNKSRITAILAPGRGISQGMAHSAARQLPIAASRPVRAVRHCARAGDGRYRDRFKHHDDQGQEGPCFGGTARQFGQTRPSILWPGPALGAHTDAVFLDMLRLGVEEIDRVWKEGAI
jgi:hypothetical protein